MSNATGIPFACVFSVVIAGCSSTWESRALQLAWDPPPGVRIVDENARTARFSDGISIHSVAGEMPAIDPEALEPLLVRALEGAKLPAVTLPVASAKAGSLPLGACARFEVRGQPERSLVYVVPLGARYVVFVLSAPPSTYGRLEAQVERSLSSLRERKD